MTRKEHLFVDQEKKCHWCGTKCHLNVPRAGNQTPPDLFTEDHVVSRGRGGKDKIENIVGACYKCNQARNSIELKLMSGKSINYISDKVLRAKLKPVGFTVNAKGRLV